MSDAIDQKTGGVISPENIDLEKRFASEQGENSIQFEEKKTVQETVGEKNAAEKDATYQNILSKVNATVQTSDKNSVAQDASVLHQKTDRDSQITHLLDIAMTKGVVHAVNVARHVEDYYMLDQLHDRLLAEDLHDALMQRGLIEKSN